MRRFTILATMIMILFVLTTGCRKTEEAEPATLAVGMMSAVDAAPFYLALDRGYFLEEGVEARLILFTNGQHRQSALQTGQVDGAMTDLVALVTQTASDFKLTGPFQRMRLPLAFPGTDRIEGARVGRNDGNQRDELSGRPIPPRHEGSGESLRQ